MVRIPKIILPLGLLLILIIVGFFVFWNGKQEVPQTTVTQQPTPVIDQALEASRDEVSIALTSKGFSPNDVTIKKGTRVIWINESGEDGTVNSNDHPTHEQYASLNLGIFPDGYTVQLVFETPGIYGYHDHLHPQRQGKITVTP